MEETGRGNLGTLLTFALALALLLNLVVPPFQSPDEPQHFSLIMANALGAASKPVIVRDIIRIMDRNDWWRLVGMRRPLNLPSEFSGEDYFSSLDVMAQPRAASFYHSLLGAAVRALGPGDALTAYYISRGISAAFFLLALFFIGLTFRGAAAAAGPFLAAAPFCVLFLPQFMLLSVSVNPDALSILMGSVFFYAAFSILGGRAGILPILAVVLTASAAFFADKSVLVLIPLLSALPFFLIRRKNLRSSLLTAGAGLLVLVLVASWVVWYFPVQAQKNIDDIARILYSGAGKEMDMISMSSFNQSFIRLLGDSFYLRFGWAAFPPGKVVQWMWRLLVLVSMCGLALFFGARIVTRVKRGPAGLSQAGLSKLAAYSLLAIGLQFGGMWLLYGTRNILVQGRYFFPIITALALVFVTGAHQAFAVLDKKVPAVALKALLLAAFFLLNFVIWHDIVPVLQLTIKSPHPGI